MLPTNIIENDNDNDLLSEVDSDSVNKNELAQWTNPPTVANLKQDYSDAKPIHESHVSDVNEWLDNLNITGNAKLPVVKGRSSIVPKLIRKQAEWRYAALSEPFLSTDNIFAVAPVSYEDKSSAVQNGLVINNQFNTKINKVKFIDEYIRTAVDEGTVVVRVGWEYEDEEEKIEVPDFTFQISNDPAVTQMHMAMQQQAESDPEGFAKSIPPEMLQAHQIFLDQGVPYVPVNTGSHIETKTRIIKNNPTVEVCHYKNVVIDPSCQGDISKASFVIYNFETSLSELEKDGRYTNLKGINVSNASILSEPDHASSTGSNFNFTDEPRKKFVAYEYWGYWDIDGTGIVKPIVVTYVGNTIIRMEENPYPDKALPFIVVQYLPVRKSIYGEPDGELLEENQKIVGAVTRGMIDLMGRSANGQIGSRKDALDITNKRKFDKGQDYEFNPTVDPRQAFYMHEFPEIPQSAQIMLNMQNAEAESLTGIKSFSGGISGSALGNTATGIRSALDATSKRELGILRRLAEGVRQIGRKMISMNALFLSEEEVVRVTNEDFVTVRKDDLGGNFDLTLSISTAEADNQKAEELSYMLQTMGNTMPPDFAQMVLADIAKLRKMPDLAKRIEEYKPQPDPNAQQMAELQMELLRAQIDTEKSKAYENKALGDLDIARIATEQAKAKGLGSQADLADLDFLETESGTKHARALQSIEAQTSGNVSLKKVDHEHAQQQKLLDKAIEDNSLQGL